MILIELIPTTDTISQMKLFNNSPVEKSFIQLLDFLASELKTIM